MKNKKGQESSVVTPHLEDLAERHKSNFATQNPSFVNKPVQSADLSHDAGGAYNSNGTFPQE